MDDYQSPIDLEAIKRGTVVNKNCFGDQVMPGIIGATEAQRTAHALKQQFGGATFKIGTLFDRCEVTGNLVGTDIWPEGHPCVCKTCNRPR